MLKDSRMEAIASLIPENSVVCDIGTDHAFIPVHLVKAGISSRAVITDISRPSLEKGIKNAAEAGVSDKITPFCANGTLGADVSGVTDFIIAGMGGELIVKILSQDERLHVSGLRFVLQPMTKAPEVRRYLSENGFYFEKEKKALSDGHIYTMIPATFTGEKHPLGKAEAYLGKSPDYTDPLERSYAEKILGELETKLAGMKKSSVRGAIESEIEELIKEIKERLG